jgi:hypothetical protein
MLQVTRRASLVVVLLLLASVGTASGECAWVLWSQLMVSGRSLGDAQWEIRTAWNTREDCEKRQKTDGVRHALASGYDYIPDVHVVVAKQPDGTISSTTQYFCLPDTIDPRGPKGR